MVGFAIVPLGRFKFLPHTFAWTDEAMQNVNGVEQLHNNNHPLLLYKYVRNTNHPLLLL